MRRVLKALLFSFAVLLTGCSSAKAGTQTVEACIKAHLEASRGGTKGDSPVPSFASVDPSIDPDFKRTLGAVGQGDLKKFVTALKLQLSHCNGKPAVAVGSESLPGDVYCKATNQKMLDLASQYIKDNPNPSFDTFLKSTVDAFKWYKMTCPTAQPPPSRRGEAGGIFFTGYDSPTINCTRDAKPAGNMNVPLLGRPKDEKQNPIAYTDDPFELQILLGEGSGYCKFGPRDEDRFPIGVDGSNGKSNPSLSIVVNCMGAVREGCQPPLEDDCLERPRMTIPEMRAYFAKPENKDAFAAAKSFIPNQTYLRKTAAPMGAEDFPVTDGHSLAIPKGVPLGMVMLLDTWKPKEIAWKPTDHFSTLAIGQDRGGSIKGCHIDWYAGEDRGASNASGVMRENGSIFMAVAK